MELEDRTVLVTGGAKRIGKAIALGFAREGAHVVLHYRTSLGEAQATQNEIKGLGVECELLKADLNDIEKLPDVLAKSDSILNNVSILVNSASVFYKIAFSDITFDHWKEFLRTNLIAPFFLAQKIGLRLKSSHQDGLILNITDVGARRPAPGYMPYAASKAGLENLTRALALELAPRVRVNSIAPGAIVFPEHLPQEDREAILKRIPLKRAGDPKDIAEACLEFARNDYMNGMVLSVDGGASLG